MIRFHFTPKNNGKTPMLIALYKDDITPTGRKLWRGLTPAQKRAIKSAASSLPESGIVPIFSGDAMLLVHLLGKKDKVERRDARDAAQSIFSVAGKYKLKELLITPGSMGYEDGVAYLEGLALGAYELTQYKGKKTKDKQKKDKEVKLEKITMVGDKPSKKNKLFAAMLEAKASGIGLAKDLINFPPMDVTPTYLAKTAQKLAKDYKSITCKVIGETELKKLGCGGILGVGQGSKEESRLIILTYNGGKKGVKPVGLVGKGVTYDTGGYSLKPARYMRWMKHDMSGAATVLGALQLIADLQIKENVVVAVPTVENKVNADAYLPDDVLTMYNGMTVEIDNTDAEGRLILADALAYMADKIKPRVMLDLATLTGACEYAVGNDYSAALVNNQDVCDAVIESGKATDELVWQLPLHKRYAKMQKSSIADIVNSSPMKPGTIEGGLFLEHFVGDTPWCHLDVASVSFDEKVMLATGRNVRMLAHFVENWK